MVLLERTYKEKRAPNRVISWSYFLLEYTLRTFWTAFTFHLVLHVAVIILSFSIRFQKPWRDKMAKKSYLPSLLVAKYVYFHSPWKRWSWLRKFMKGWILPKVYGADNKRIFYRFGNKCISSTFGGQHGIDQHRKHGKK